MKYIKQKIIEYFNKNSIEMVGFDEGCGDASEVAIRIKLSQEDSQKWEYFINRLNKEYIIANSRYQSGVFHISFNAFNSVADIEQLKRDMYVFYEQLKKGYYQVNPKVRKMSVLIKPTHRCNLNCKYCYDRPYRDTIKKDLDLSLLEDFIKKLSQYTQCVQLIWHGGEPTLMGTSWYKKVYNEILSKYPMLSIESSLMSNGTNYNKAWFELFRKYKISAGMSYNAMYQNELRCFGGKAERSYSKEEQWNLDMGERAYSRVNLENTLITFKEQGLDLGTIDVITGLNYKQQIEIYEYYKKIGCKACLNHFFYSAEVMENGLAVAPKEYAGEFLKYFRYWLYDKEGIYERSASEALGFVIGLTNSCCENQDCRNGWLGLNPEGDLYPCDRYYPEEYKIGNIKDFSTIGDIFKSGKYLTYCNEIQDRFDNKCGSCGYFFACKGGCNASSIETSGSGAGVDEFSCELFKLKFNGVYDILRDVDILKDKLNPFVRKTLISNGFYSIKDIKCYIREEGKSIELQYDKDNLFRCSEYEIFRGINFVKDGKGMSIHGDFINCDDPATTELNEKKRKEDFFNYLREVLKNVCVQR